MPIKSQMCLIMGQMELEHPGCLPLNSKKLRNLTLSLASTNINQSTLHLVKMFVTIRSWMSLIMDLIKPEVSE